MNIYLVVEGAVSEKMIYTKWIPLLNSSLEIVTNIDDVVDNNVFIISGCGYPSYFDIIKNAIDDINTNNNFDRLVIAVDSEDMSYDEKKNEIVEFVELNNINIDYKIVVQHFCIEAWALGNTSIVQRNSQCEYVKQYRRIHDVLVSDPEELPALDDEDMNRAQFAEKYLRKLLNSRFKNLTYSKRNPSVLLHHKYYERVKGRFDGTGQIQSFNDFLCAFT